MLKKALLSILTFASALCAAEKPNIIFLFSDDHASNAISCYPGGLFDEIAPTPGIDRIGNEGLRFDRSYCTNAICGPSRASILTGKHSHLNGFIDNEASHFDGLQTTFPQLLRNVGYRTAMIGKWHLHSNPVGFDYWEIFPGQGNYYNPDFIQMDGKRQRFPGHCNDLVTKKGLTWLKKNKDKPFVAMVQYKAPHRNWAPALRHLTLFDNIEMPEPDSLFDDYSGRSKVLKEQEMSIANHFHWGHDMKFEGESLFPKHFRPGAPNKELTRMPEEQKEVWRAAYNPKNEKFIAAMKAGKLDDKAITRWKYQRYIKDYLRSIRSMDEGITKILDYLDESGLAENTIVVYSSDQGFYLGEHGWYDKRWMFEESFQMPFLVRWPGTIKPGSSSQALIQNIDYAPTFLDICGAEIPASMQGKSLLPIFKKSGEKPADWRDSLYYAYYGERTHHVAAHDGVVTDRYKLFWIPKTEEYQLFDLKKDPKELQSVAKDPEYASTFAFMKKELEHLREKYHAHDAVLPTPQAKDKGWMQRHQKMNQLAEKQSYDLLFIGDSITHGFEGAGKAVWEKYYAPRNALNLGIGGDRTQHVLWRLNHGNLRGQQNAKVAVLMIGTNNVADNKAYETADGIEMILSTLRARCPKTKVLLLDIFPRGEKADDPARIKNAKLNKLIAKFADGKRVHYLDISSAFLGENGQLSKEIMPDHLHPNEKGYKIWAEEIEPKLKELGL